MANEDTKKIEAWEETKRTARNVAEAAGGTALAYGAYRGAKAIASKKAPQGAPEATQGLRRVLGATARTLGFGSGRRNAYGGGARRVRCRW